MAKNVKSYFDTNGAYYTGYPVQPPYCPGCPVNVKYDTLPNSWPRHTTVMGPSNVKHLYTGIPNYYPPQIISRPIGTMYDTDLSRFGPHGNRETYGFQAYPFMQHSIQETREYSDSFIPVLDLKELTKYHTVRDGAWGR